MRKALLILLSIFIAGTVMAQNSVRSVGSGPAFEIVPAVVFANENGIFQIGVFSTDGSPVNFEAYFNGEMKTTFDRQWTFEFTLPEDRLYDYIIFKSVDGNLTSVATALVLASKLKTGIESGAGFSFFPTYNGYMKGNETIFAILTAGYGHEDLKLSLDASPIFDTTLNPVSNLPAIFATQIDTSKFKDGFHKFSISSSLVTGQILTDKKVIGIDNIGPKMVSYQGQELFFEGKFEITIEATDAIGLSRVYLYKKGSDNSLILLGNGRFVDGKSTFKIDDFSGEETFVTRIIDQSGNICASEFSIVNNKPFLIPLVIIIATIGVIVLSLIR